MEKNPGPRPPFEYPRTWIGPCTGISERYLWKEESRSFVLEALRGGEGKGRVMYVVRSEKSTSGLIDSIAL